MSNTTLTFPSAEPPPPGTVTAIAPGVYWMRAALPFALDHINLWLLEDGAGWTIVDCGFGSDETREHWERVFAEVIAPARVNRVLVTHFHPDHFGLAAWVEQRWRVPVHLSAPEFDAARGWYGGAPFHTRNAHLAMFRAHGLELGDAGREFATSNLYRRGVPAIPERAAPLGEGDRLSIGGREWRAIAGYGHSPEHISFYCDELRVLIAGDMVLPRISTNVSVQPREPEANPLEWFLASLRRYAPLPAKTLVLPSHGLPFRGLHARIAQLTSHHEARLADLERACAKPVSAAALMKVIFRGPLDTHQTFFAMGETLSHLNKLVHDGALERVQGPGGYRFAAVAPAARATDASEEEITG